jgi:two-component sensor histidine kinase
MLQSRINSLAAAHRYVSPSEAAPAASAHRETAKGLLRILTAPYNGQFRETIVVEGEDAPIGLQAAGTLALIVHELATNAMKYGALSSETGRVRLSCAAVDGRYTIDWREEGGPNVAGAPQHWGFGSTFFDRLAASAQVDFQRIWRAEGLEVSISMSLKELEA